MTIDARRYIRCYSMLAIRPDLDDDYDFGSISDEFVVMIR
jgi:hypothetical protein